MIALLKWMLARWALFKLLLKSFGALAWLLPIAMLLKALGWPILLVLGVLAVPLFIVLMIVGLPLLLVAAAAGVMLMIALWVVSTGLLLIKIAVPILLVVWLIRWIRGFNRGRGNGGTPARPGGSGPADGSGVGAKVPKPPTAGSAASDMPESGFAEG
jgi:hypothetical protein